MFPHLGNSIAVEGFFEEDLKHFSYLFSTVPLPGASLLNTPEIDFVGTFLDKVHFSRAL